MNPYPGGRYLQGRFEGCEPCESAALFKKQADWRTLDAKLLNENYTALSFFLRPDCASLSLPSSCLYCLSDDFSNIPHLDRILRFDFFHSVLEHGHAVGAGHRDGGGPGG